MIFRWPPRHRKSLTGTKGRYYKKLNHGGEYVIYKLDEGKRAKTVTAETWYYKSNNTLAADCTVETSADGTVFQRWRGPDCRRSGLGQRRVAQVTFTASGSAQGRPVHQAEPGRHHRDGRLCTRCRSGV